MSDARQRDIPILAAEHLTRLYADGQVAALRDVSLQVHAGEYLAIMGPSGSGKSTLLQLLGALDVPTSGEVYFQGQPLSRMKSLSALRSAQIGFVFQSFYLLPNLTALENVQLPMFEGPLSAANRKGKAVDLLTVVGMAHRADHLPNRLSVGERQRVAIARALANDPVLLLADEPTGNLDSQTGEGVLDLFAELHRQRGVTLVVVTHEVTVAARAERLIRMRDGRIESEERMGRSTAE
ncbi:MAG: ABC transporter [Planctomycetes bacterium RBG_16_64_10]|nr:MAG: ABC transporter [Planctomycetes bacterium RBG_16_64_10]